LEAFEFVVVEFVKDTSLLTTREQVHLDWLFSLSSELRYNICPTAESRLGTTHTAETKAAMSKAHIGKTLSTETKAAMSKAKSGENHPMYGKTHTAESIDLIAINHPNRKPVYVYDLDNKLVGSILHCVRQLNLYKSLHNSTAIFSKWRSLE